MKYKSEIKMNFIKILIKCYRLNFAIFNSSRIKNDKFNNRNKILFMLKMRRIMYVSYRSI